jgi:hypothetical protein
MAQDVAPAPVLNPGERWADQVNADLDALGPTWRELVTHAGTATAPRPSGRWQRWGRELLAEVGPDAYRVRAVGWLGLVGGPLGEWEAAAEGEPTGYARFEAENATVLRGLVWLLALVPAHHETARALGDLVEIALRPVAGRGPRSPKVANAGVYALSRLNGDTGLGQLVRLASRITYRGTLKQIHAALDARAGALGLSRADVEERSIPVYGLTEVGRRVERLGDFTAELLVSGGQPSLTWRNAAGATMASVPVAVRREHAEQLAELRGAVRDIGKMLTAQRYRLDRLFVSAPAWRFAVWRERYLDHPLVGTLARRLIWTIDGQSVGYADGELRTVEDAPVHPDDDATVGLWHPVNRPAHEVLAWRGWLERHGIRQPFKQAHREVYRMTADEEATSIYSNRFAGHVLRQHQFHALVTQRGWRDRLRMARDDTVAPATRELPDWELRAEFWIAPADDGETLASGAYQHVVTDQVRFYPLTAPESLADPDTGRYEQWVADGEDPVAPVPLDRIAPLVFSEILRDVDIAVGVSSVGSDPTWRDGGPQRRYRDYWRDYRFGDLSAAARTRRDLLAHLLPRLGVGDRCRVQDRFLVVHGDLHDYKIHLGSGSAVMSPDNTYLSITPEQAASAGEGDAFVPFDGDDTLKGIIGTALLLAHDTEVTDPRLRRDLEQAAL